MSYSTNMAGLDLFTAPFRSAQASSAAAASRPQQPKATAPLPKAAVSPQQPKATAPLPKAAVSPQQPKATAPLPKSSVSPQQQAKSAASQPVKPKAPAIQTQEPNIPQKSVPTEKAPTVQTGQDKSPEPEQKSQAEAQAPAKALPSAQAQSEPPAKELTMDMSDRTIPAGKPLDASEDAKRKAHEEAEAKHKAEWEAKQLAKKQEREAALEKIKSMSDADIVSASTERVRVDTEKLTRRNMKECVAEHIQSVCCKDPAFARQTMNPNKSMIHCFHYINRMAKDYLQQEMKDNDIKPENGVYGGDVPDDLVYQWSIDYFNDPDAQEDHVEEEKFTPRPYVNAASKAKGTTKSKKTAKKETEKKQEPKKNDYQQMSLPGVS